MYYSEPPQTSIYILGLRSVSYLQVTFLGYDILFFCTLLPDDNRNFKFLEFLDVDSSVYTHERHSILGTSR